MEEFDVVIAGAGLAGLHCARTLSANGVRVLLVDCKSSLSESVHTTGIFVRRTLEDFDLPGDCLGPEIRDVSLYSPARRRMDLQSPHPEFRVGKMGQLYERYLGQCVENGVSWWPKTRYAKHRSSPSGLVIQLDNDARSRLVHAKFLIGADGANSRVARNLNLANNREWIVGIEDVFVDVPLVGPPRLHAFLDPVLAPGYLAWVANDGDEVHVGVGGYADRFDPAAALESFRSSLSDIVDLNQASHAERRAGRIPVGGVLPNICNSRGLLVGDAAGAVSPLTAGGLDPCLRLSALAAQVVTEFIRTGNEAVLQRYSGCAFRARFASRLWMRRMLSSFESSFSLEIGCAALRMPVLNRIAWHVFFGRNSFPDVAAESEAGTVILELPVKS
jgi:flavin-dependent dehydrogenase